MWCSVEVKVELRWCPAARFVPFSVVLQKGIMREDTSACCSLRQRVSKYALCVQRLFPSQ